MKAVLFLAILGVVNVLPACAKAKFHFTPNNATDVSGSRRTNPLSVALTVAKGMKTIASVWKSLQKKTSIKLHITNLLNGDLKIPQWYSLHGHASVLPPPVINQGEAITEIQFDKTVDSGQGTEGILAYNINTISKTIYLLIQWRVPQFGITEDISFDCQVVNANVDRNFLQNRIKSNKGNLKKSKDRKEYITAVNGIYSVHSAMGTQNLVTLNVVVTSQ